MTVEDSLKLIEHYGVTLVILAVIGGACATAAALAYREWLHWRPRIEGWINDWMVSREKTEDLHRTSAAASLDMQRSNSLTLQGCALTLKSVHELLLKDKGCPLDLPEDAQEMAELRRQVRTQRKLSESRHPTNKPEP